MFDYLYDNTNIWTLCRIKSLHTYLYRYTVLKQWVPKLLPFLFIIIIFIFSWKCRLCFFHGSLIFLFVYIIKFYFICSCEDIGNLNLLALSTYNIIFHTTIQDEIACISPKMRRKKKRRRKNVNFIFWYYIYNKYFKYVCIFFIIVTLCIYAICNTKYMSKIIDLHPAPWTYRSLYTIVTLYMHSFKILY